MVCWVLNQRDKCDLETTDGTLPRPTWSHHINLDPEELKKTSPELLRNCKGSCPGTDYLTDCEQWDLDCNGEIDADMEEAAPGDDLCRRYSHRDQEGGDIDRNYDHNTDPQTPVDFVPPTPATNTGQRQAGMPDYAKDKSYSPPASNSRKNEVSQNYDESWNNQNNGIKPHAPRPERVTSIASQNDPVPKQEKPTRQSLERENKPPRKGKSWRAKDPNHPPVSWPHKKLMKKKNAIAKALAPGGDHALLETLADELLPSGGRRLVQRELPSFQISCKICGEVCEVKGTGMTLQMPNCPVTVPQVLQQTIQLPSAIAFTGGATIDFSIDVGEVKLHSSSWAVSFDP